ncbi:hypothetical protein EMIT0196MI5_100132 [Pseudomonas sp. IT-196MI5]
MFKGSVTPSSKFGSERFGPWSTVYQRFRDWRNRGTFDQMLRRLHIKLSEQG